MVGWFKITINTNGWNENKTVICGTIKPTVEKLEKKGDILNFFFFEYYGGDNTDKVTLTFYGDENKVMDELRKYGIKPNIKRWDPASQYSRFGDYYQLGIKIFEIGSRLALYRIDNKYPIDKIGQPDPILMTLTHVYLQNLGYSPQEEAAYSQLINFALKQTSDLMYRFELK